MTPRVWFILALRILGAWQALLAFESLVTMFNIARGLYRPSYTEANAFFTHAFAYFVLAGILLKGAPIIAGLFYPVSAQGSQSDSKQ